LQGGLINLKALIVGAGSLGSYFGSLIHEAGAEITLYDINQEKVDKINSDGVIIHEKDAGKHIVKVRAIANIEETPPVDFIIILVKAYNTERAAREIALIVNQDSMVLTLQNGLGNVVQLAQHIPEKQLFAGVTYHSAYGHEGKTYHTGSGLTIIAPVVKKSIHAAMDQARFLNNCNISAGATTDIDPIRWKKLIVNSAINPLSAIYGLKNGQLPKHPEAVRDMATLVVEGVAVAQKIGLPLNYGEIWATVLDTCRSTAENRSSMLRDVDEGRQTEIQAINGSIIRHGEINGVDTPTNIRMLRSVVALSGK
jgi:2-dehydropantoate 2-reductase